MEEIEETDGKGNGRIYHIDSVSGMGTEHVQTSASAAGGSLGDPCDSGSSCIPVQGSPFRLQSADD